MDDPRPGPSATVRRYATRARARGPAEVATAVLGAAGSWWSSRGRLRFLTRPTKPEDAEVPGLAMRPATPADGDRYARHVGTDSASTFRSRLSSETDCYLVLDDDRIVHASWVTRRGAWVGELGRYLLVPSGSVYVYESFTSPPARGRGIYPAMLRYIASEASRDGANELWIGVGVDNAPSIRAISKAGFVPAFDVGFSRRFGRIRIDGVEGPRSDEMEHLVRATWPPIAMAG